MLAQKVTKETVPGVTNFARLETTVACAGATKVEAVPEIKKMGFASIINLRQASEQGANVEAEAAAAKAAGLRFYTCRSTGSQPDPAVADRFSTRSPRRAANRRSFTAPAATAPPRCG